MKKGFIVFLSFFLVSCAHVEHVFNRFSTESAKKDHRTDELRMIEACIERGDYEHALRSLEDHAERNDERDHAGNLYIKAMNGYLSRGKDLYDNKEYGRAGVIFYRADLFMEKIDYHGKGLNYSRSNVQWLRDECSAAILQEGMFEYRKGNLGRAISIWEDVLKFDRDNRIVNKAITTARKQLDNLQRIDVTNQD